jgi:hypothetical protein
MRWPKTSTSGGRRERSRAAKAVELPVSVESSAQFPVTLGIGAGEGDCNGDRILLSSRHVHEAHMGLPGLD